MPVNQGYHTKACRETFILQLYFVFLSLYFLTITDMGLKKTF